MNQSKIAILNCLSGGEWWTTPQVAQWCGLRLSNASQLLRVYRGQGLVNRKRNFRVSIGFLYRITAVGLERLRYFNSGVAATSSSMANDIGLNGTEKLLFEEWVTQKLGGN